MPILGSRIAYDGTATATISIFGSLTGVVAGDDVTLNTSSAAAAFADRHVGVGKTVTLSSLALNGAEVGNYSIANQTTTADITAKGVVVTGLIAANKVYDGNTTATITNYGTLTGVVPGDGVTLNTSGVTAAFADKDVGAGKTVTVSGLALSGADAGNYSLTQPAALADITARSASVTANDRPKIYGETVTFAGTEFSTSGFVSGDVVTSVTLTSAGAAAAVNVDNYAIVPSAAVGTGLANKMVSCRW